MRRPTSYIRDRALTLRDLEVLGLQFSPDIAQVRALGSGSSVKLVVVARGSDPRPARAVLREIVPYLLEHAAPGLAEKGAMVAVATHHRAGPHQPASRDRGD